MTTPTPAEVEIAEVLAAHDDPSGWMWSDSDQMVYACECGDHYDAGAIAVIQEADVLAAAAWHRAHVAEQIAATLADLLARARGEALREAADEVNAEGYYDAAFILRDRADRQEQP